MFNNIATVDMPTAAVKTGILLAASVVTTILFGFAVV